MKRSMRGVLVCGVALALSACATHDELSQPTQSVAKLPASSAPVVYAPAQNQATVQVKVVKEYIPVAVPGQLMPMPSAVGPSGLQGAPGSQAPVFLSKEAAVQYANQHALQNPQSQDFFNAMMTYDFMPGALYTVYTAPMNITDIVFERGEKVISIAAGDTLRWQISQTYSGQGADMQQHLLVKPNNPGLTNTVVVTTNKRVYHLVLNSTTDNTYMVSVNWRYPGNMVQFAQGVSNNPAEAAASADTALGGSPFQLDLGDLDFNYQFGLVTGNKPSWYPVRVFNDGRQTFIEFPQSFLAGSAALPMLFVADNNDHYGTMVNWRQKGRYMIVDTVIHKARLQTGVKSDDKTVVQIDYNNPVK